MSESPVRRVVESGGAVVRLVLDRPKGNVLDGRMVAALRREVAALCSEQCVTAILFEGAGRHFSFGASVEEHTKERVADMLVGFHGLFRDLAACGKVLLAAVRGQCLGGGLELAAFCDRIVAAPDAQLGCPEIKLGVFAPVGSMLLPWRMRHGPAIDLLLSGRSIDAETARAALLVDQVAADPVATLLDWHREHLASHSAAALGFALRAARDGFHRKFLAGLDRLERLYLDELAATADANEGIAAFLEHRSPTWTHR